jgi:CubicO group peptidase (beta-lactamase class C family)
VSPAQSWAEEGAGGQITMIIPTHDLVVVRLGHYKGEEAGARALNQALALLVDAVPSHP